MRPTVFASALMIASGTVLPALAQDAAPASPFDAATAVEGFLTNATLLGADSATVESVTTDGDTIIANGVSLRWHVEVGAPAGRAEVDASAEMGTLRITGFEQAEDGYKASAIYAPAIKVSVSGTGVDDDADTDADAFNYETTFVEYGIKDVAWTKFPQIGADPAAPLSRFAPLLDWSIAMSYGQNTIERIESHLTTGGDTQDSSYGPFTVGGYADGKIAEITYPAFSVDQQTEIPMPPAEGAAPGAAGKSETVNLHAEYGEITATGIDIRPYVQLLTGNGDLTGPNTVLDTFRMDGMSMSFDSDDVADFSLGPIAGSSFTVDPATGPLLTKFDALVLTLMAGEETNPMMPMMLALDIYGALGIGSYTISDVAFSGQGVTAKLDEFALENLSSEGMGRLAVSGGAMSGDGRTGALDTFEVSNIVFPNRDDFIGIVVGGMMGMPFDPSNLEGMPTLGGLKVKGLQAQLPGDTGEELNVGLFDLTLGSYIKGIPTNIKIALEGLSLPASKVGFEPAQMVLSSIGADPVKAEGALELQWNEDNQTVSLDDSLSIEGVGRYTATAELSGIPRTVFENIMTAQQAIATAAVGDITVRYEDEGVVPALLGMFAQMSGATSEEFAAGIAGQVQMQVGMMAGEALATTVGDALRAFLADPESLTIKADPDNAVPVAQLVGAAMTAPAQIANILKLSITAND